MIKLIARFAAREAGHHTADLLRWRSYAPLYEAEAAIHGETMLHARLKIAMATAEVAQAVWRALARKPWAVLVPIVAVTVLRAAWMRRKAN